MFFIGLDAGSVAVKIVVLDGLCKKLEGHYVRHYGHALPSAFKLLEEIARRYPGGSISVTGSAGKSIAMALGIKPVNEIVSQTHAARRIFPQVRTIIELGGEDSKLVLVERGRIRDFSMNSVCAAGTGSFLEQQAERLNLTIEEFSRIAAAAIRPSKIAGRCSVFAKSDMIHLQQIATPLESIVAGLCFAVARNFKGAITKGRELGSPVAFQGGVAANEGMARAFREVFGLEELFIPPDFALMGAWGAALKDMDEGRVVPLDLEKLGSYAAGIASETGHVPLLSAGDDFFERHGSSPAAQQSSRAEENDNKTTELLSCCSAAPIGAYLGIDIGSISTNLAVIDGRGDLLAKRYLMTAGRPIDAVRRGLEEICRELGDSVEILGVGTTGSGRYMIADYVGADIVKNEITAQATAAAFIDPSVDTIFEIGGQDSKYISIKDGIIVDFEMNKACAAGTGSFIEEQAEKLDVSVKDEFAEYAFSSKAPCRLGERCTVFMENSLMANLQRGVDRNNLLAGLAYSIVQNYINRVVAGKHIGGNIFFQGGVAFNKAVVAAFEKYLDRKVTVPPNHDVTGAIGMALIAKDYMGGQRSEVGSQKSEWKTKFKGFGLSKRKYEIDSFGCKGCPNVCEINRVKIEGEKDHLFYGGRCEKYDVSKLRKSFLPDLFAFREELLWKEHNRRLSAAGSRQSVRIGVPYIFYFHDYLPFWTTFLWELGFEVVVSPKTNKQIINLGLENVLSEACFPIKVAHGHIKHLMDAGVDGVFVPSFITVDRDKECGLACPHTQTIPYVSKAAIKGARIISPVVNIGKGRGHLKKELARAFGEYSVGKRDIEKALSRAESVQAEFSSALREKGREILGPEARKRGRYGPVVVIVGRSYNSSDSGINLEIPKKLANIDTLSVPMDFLPLDAETPGDTSANMYWRSGINILKAAKIIRRTPELHAIYIGNFSCGPDSFILKYFREEMEGKPFLHLEIDEHSADAGAVTRCEAFLDSIGQQSSRAADQQSNRAAVPAAVPRCGSTALKGRTVFIPRMADHAFALKAAFEYCGVSAEVLPESDRESVDIGRKHVSGKECYPYLVTTGDMLKKVFSSGFTPGSAAFFMPSGTGPCRFGQYNVAQRLVLQGLGLGDIPIFSPNQDVQFYRDLGIAGKDFSMQAWKGIIAYELLTKCLHETRPNETSAGEADKLYVVYHGKIYSGLKAGNGSMPELLKKMKRDFMAVPRSDHVRPVIGVVGEIFVRSNRFSNENLIGKIEALGGEVRLAPIEEWIYYVNAMSFRKALIKRDRSAIMNIFVKRLLQKRIEHRFARQFSGFLKACEEPDTRDILKKAEPYVHDSFEGETVLSIGKTIDLIEKGASGVINAMPFGCMPGTIVTALMKGISEKYGVPCISMPYDGAESSSNELQLEAFMETVTSSCGVNEL